MIRHLQGALAMTSALALAACASDRIPPRPDALTLGRNAAGEPCTAAREWRDATVTDALDQSWSIKCRNVAAARPVGAVHVVRSPAALAKREEQLACGAAAPATLPGIGRVSAKRCRDSLIGAETVAYSFRRGDSTVVVSAAPAVLGPAEEAARLVANGTTGRGIAGGDPGRATTSAIEVAGLAPSPTGSGDAAGTQAFDASVALAEGISLNTKGLHVEASRVLNDALSRLPATAPPTTRAELLLEAGLADSNIRFQDSATEDFAQAERLIGGAGGERVPLLRRKLDAYRALDLLNQRKFREALGVLDRLVSRPVAADQPLSDPAIIRQLNETAAGTGSASRSVAVPNVRDLEQPVLDAQANWARSVALLAIGETAQAQVAIDRASTVFQTLIRAPIDPRLILWLGARIDRQQGRLQARRGDYAAAIASFDRALAGLRRGAIETQGTGTEPAIAETQLERAGIVADRGGDPARVRADYDAAVDAMIAASQSGGGFLPIGIERYLDLLVAEGGNAARPETAERFFRAMQAVGEPAVARQLSQIQSVVTADPEVGVKVRDRAELERTITRLRYEIAAGGATDAAALEKERQVAEAKLLQIDAELSADQRFRSTDDKPATIAEIRAALRPGEAFLKITQLSRRSYGIVITGDRSWIYPLELPNAALKTIADGVRASIDGKLDQGLLVPYDVAGAYGLFRLVTGPAREAVLAAKGLVVDPAGPLEALPAAVLVTDEASVRGRAAIAKARPFDFSQVHFLAEQATLSTAVSPRSFLVARALKPSTARQPFLGLGEHQPAAATGPARTVNVGFGCQVPFQTLANLSNQLKPIAKRELDLAAASLGVPNAPEIVGPAFTDTAVEARSDLGDYEVLHFATHGLQEGVWGCAKSPPALVTSFGDQDSDGLLSFSEIARLRLDANLVVLSACDTASGVRDEALARRSGQEEAGSTLEGLVRAFLTANSRAVLATYWPVSAEADGDLFIRTFYASARTRNIGGALQAAQAALIANPDYSHPFHWGPFFVVGDSTKMMLSGPAAKIAAR